ncbi:pectate lyase-domain-containing protein [Fimicolochytrium jonesii]|uniref:pectate lyase-domain-containing protein n=1 Tax=Fimicolochytrium jonesii TaxID=1396493 RepID=UPI0022FE7D87|nr:pectate lyase-domain-containing protein [Fimicolochytrium jonesii]KAI8821350.1 pectate lyase-domain-containing protein [Fimicolochytrium jonesii]
MQIKLLSLALVASAAVVSAAAIESRELINIAPKCTKRALDFHDCNVALLTLKSDNGRTLTGKVNQLLTSAGKTLSSTSGKCKVTVTAVGGGESIAISKGRIEKLLKSVINKCGAGQSGIVTGEGGSDIRGVHNQGSIQLELSKPSGGSPKPPKTAAPKPTTTVAPPQPTSAPTNPPSGGPLNTGVVFPEAKGSVTFNAPHIVPAGTVFDGGYKRFGRGVKCTGQAEGGNKDAVFQVEDGATLQNVLIGADQIEGVHCMGSCKIINVYWEAVCEDALTFKGDGDAQVIGGGARDAADKVMQHNGIGNIHVEGFAAENFGKLYRSCGNCKKQGKRTISMNNVVAIGGKVLAGVNANFGDVATIQTIAVSDVKSLCTPFEGNDSGDEPGKLDPASPAAKRACGSLASAKIEHI